jgi:gliding motility-associated-like protein
MQPCYRPVFPLLFSLLYFHLPAQTPFFTLPDTVCTNTPVKITNATVGGTSYYWNFCVADINTIPAATNLGNISGLLTFPVFIDIVSDNGNYYGFLTNWQPGGLVRLDFGNSMLNTPTAVNLGNFGGILPNGAEGIQVVKSNGKWYAIIVAGGIESGSSPGIIRVEIGTDITNSSPVATNWGNLGNTLQAIDFFLINENNDWHGFTVNAENNTATIFDFGVDFTNPPIATNLGNVGGLLNYPTGICAINDAGNWHLFITNANAPSLVRLDFGNSLLNVPLVTNLGNPGNTLNAPRDVTVLKFCDEIVGFITNANSNDLVKLDFKNDLLGIPSAVSLGNIGGFSFPHSLSKLFRVGSDLYSFIPNAHNNSLSRIQFAGCDNSSLPNSNLQDPPLISYSKPGLYNINLLMDEGLSTQASFCKSITVLSPPPPIPVQDSSFCGDSIWLRSRFAISNWNNGSSDDSLLVKQAGKYWANTDFYGCPVRDSFSVMNNLPAVKSIADTFLCAGSGVLLKTDLYNADSLRWTPSSGLSDPSLPSPLARPFVDTRYIVAAYNHQCVIRDTVMLSVRDTPVVNISPDTLICIGGMAHLIASGAATYQWFPATGLSDPSIGNPLASPPDSLLYRVKATGANTCFIVDSVFVGVRRPADFTITPPADICFGDSISLRTGGGDAYKWISDIGPQDPFSPRVKVSPATSTSYQVLGFDYVCDIRDTLTTEITVLSRPVIGLSKSNDIDCVKGDARLTASGGNKYTWSPANSLSSPFISNPVARVGVSTLFTVSVTDANGCASKDSIEVLVAKNPSLSNYPVASAFTPNGDGHNDCFGIRYWGYIGSFEMSVFNRWGEKVFYTRDPAGCWDGTFRGQMQPAGTYVYMIRAMTLCGAGARNGAVTLVR